MLPSADIAPTENTVQADAPADIMTRVYGEDYSDEIFAEVSISGYTDFVRKFTENGSRYIYDYGMATQGANMYARNYIIRWKNSLWEELKPR
jgi:hypothetical protein